ncbi:MAG: hypothetical protein H0W73_00765 [Bacteroidetes bacterium]|nr:hypothetical protein [Bacteroidota bacterium]
MSSFGQDSTKCFEFGSSLLTVNSFTQNTYFAQDRSQFEFLNGIFFRYTKKRFAFRASTSYSDNYSEFKPPITWIDAGSGSIHNKDFRIGIGGQFSFIKKGWFYLFNDLSYRYLFSTGEYSGGITGDHNTFKRRSNGFESLTGFGFKIHVFKKIYISPEFGYNISVKFVTARTISPFEGKQTKYSYFDLLANSILKLHLTFKIN